MVDIPHFTAAETATIINAIITVIQHTFELAIVVVLIYVMRSINSAITWTVVTQKIHSSLWASLLQTESSPSGGAGSRVFTISCLALVGEVLIVAVGIITPLGLSNGPSRQTKVQHTGATHVPDTSPIGLATSPPDEFSYSRICGAFSPVPCPRNGNDGNTSQIVSSIFETFSSTPYGPFNIHYRRFYKGTGGYNYSMAVSELGTMQSFILRGDIFAIDGLIVDLSANPGIGFWNHTFPAAPYGGSWSTDVLWLEPISRCVNKNLSLDYILQNNLTTSLSKPKFNLTDRGGFVNLTTDYPSLNHDGQHISLYEHAFKSAAITNSLTMQSFNINRAESYIGKTIPFNATKYSVSLGKLQPYTLSHLTDATNQTPKEGSESLLQTLCRGYGGGDSANITNVGVHCSLLVGPPDRTDGGNPRIPSDNSTWRQTLYTCASTTRARMQKVHFSFNGSMDLANLRITRENTNTSVLWAIETTSLSISDVDLLWGHVNDSYEHDPLLSTTRSEVLYIPAGGSDIFGGLGAGMPSTAPAAAWSFVHSQADKGIVDYSGSDNFALLNKWRSLINADPVNGPAQIFNLIWTDVVSNTLVGTHGSMDLWFSENVLSVSYDLRYGIPVALLLALWLPAFLMTILIFLIGSLKLSNIRHLLNQTSVGRIITGTSALQVVRSPSTHPSTTAQDSCQTLHGDSSNIPTPADIDEKTHMASTHLCTKDWSNTFGQRPVIFGHPESEFIEAMKDGLATPGAATKRTADDFDGGSIVPKNLRKALADFSESACT